jgi:hypothetical protein
MWRFKLTNLVRSDYSIAVDQIIRYPVPSNNSRYTFSFCAFPEASFAEVVAGYCNFSRAITNRKDIARTC